MKKISLVPVAAFVLSLAAGCSCNDLPLGSGNGSGTGLGGPSAGNPPLAGTGDVYCERHCKGTEYYVLPNHPPATNANWKPFKLEPGERQSLLKATSDSSHLGGSPHLHAEVAHGSLVFHADNDTTHLAGTEPGSMVIHDATIAQPAAHLAVLATPEAAALLRQRTAG